MPLVILATTLIIILSVVLIPLAIAESKELKKPNNDYNEFYPIEYK